MDWFGSQYRQDGQPLDDGECALKCSMPTRGGGVDLYEAAGWGARPNRNGAGPGDLGQSAGHRFDCHPFNPSDLSDLFDHSDLDALSRAATIDCGTRGHDRRVQLF